jgi:hypothetical protein
MKEDVFMQDKPKAANNRKAREALEAFLKVMVHNSNITPKNKRQPH